MDQPWTWLAAGWRDLWSKPAIGLTYGSIFAAGGAVLTWLVLDLEIYYLTFPLAAGFFLVGPIVAAGLYEVSRRLRKGEQPSLRDALTAVGRNPAQIGLVGVTLLLMHIFWVQFASLYFMLYYSDTPPPVDPAGFLAIVLSVQSIPFLVIGFAFGAVLAAVVFAVSVVSIPLLIDRPEAGVMTAISTSWMVAWRNKRAMALWAWLVVLFIGVGIATAFIGLIVTLPLVGHATWAAYKDSVAWGDET
jgi:uncharacterized membrane protein